MLPCRKILCAVDFSERSGATVEMAADLAKAIHAELTLAHVRTGGAFDVAPPSACAPEADERFTALISAAKLRAGRNVDVVVTRGEPAREILRLAETYDFVVTGTRGRHPLRRAVTGSVAEKVVRCARCNVLVVRPSTCSDED
jgi:nucleotide-binding universal stress UspA family protein